MFILRLEHEKAFSEASIRRFAKKVVRMLKRDQRNASSNVKDDDFMICVDRWIKFAQSHEIRTEIDIYSICEAAILFQSVGVDIRTHNAVSSLLTDHRIPIAERASLAKRIAIEHSDSLRTNKHA
jgi:hypothetical protein